MKTCLKLTSQLYQSFLRHLFILTLVLLGFSVKTSALNYYWVGGTGNWSDLSHWATTSGGTTLHFQIPTALDDVFFDANSFSSQGQIVTFDALTGLVHNIDFSGMIHYPVITGSNLLKIYGSLTLVANMDLSGFTGEVHFEATAPGQTITMAGQHFSNAVEFNGIGGEWTLLDTFNDDYPMTLNCGTLNLNNQTVNISAFYSSPATNTARTLNMGSSILNISGTSSSSCWQVWPMGLTLNCGTSEINMNRSDAQLQGNINGNITLYDVNFTANTGDAYIGGKHTFHNVDFGSNVRIDNSNTFYVATFHGDGELHTNNHFHELNFTAAHSYLLYSGTTQTIDGSFNASGNCGGLVTINSNIPGSYASISHATGAIDIFFAVLHDIHATGGASFTATQSTDLGNNLGWTFTASAPQNLYWVGDGGNWDDGNHWSLTSGGAPSGCPPTPLDNVFFDANSFSMTGQTVLINAPIAYCRNMSWAGVSNGPAFSMPFLSEYILKIYGSLAFDPAMIVDIWAEIDFEATTPGQTITMATQHLALSEIHFNGIGGEWTLQDEFTTDYMMYLNGGTLNFNSQTVNASAFYSNTIANTTRALNMGSSIFNISGSSNSCWDIRSNGLTLNCGTSTINFNNPSFGLDMRGDNTGNLVFYDVNFSGGGPGSIMGSHTFHNVDFAAGGTIYDHNVFNSANFHNDGIISESNVFNDLFFSPAHSYILRAGKTQTVNGIFGVTGNCSALITINSNTTGSYTTISHPAGVVDISYAVIHDIHTTGGGNFTASHSTDLGNNTGWTFAASAPQNLYWVGDAGNWDDGNHWSLTSGGVPSGCTPTPLDNVFFDVNSFTQPGQTVSINTLIAYCRDMNWTAVSNGPTFSIPFLSGNILKIYGSLTFDPGMVVDVWAEIDFEATTPGQTIAMANQHLALSEVHFNGIGGEWTLQDEFTTNYIIYLDGGTLNFNNQTVNASAFSSWPLTPATRALNMGSSVFNISGSSNSCWNISSNGLTLNSGTSTINFNNPSYGLDMRGDNTGNLIFYDVNFSGGGAGSIMGSHTFHNVNFTAGGTIYDHNIFNSATFNGDGTIAANNVFNDLNCTAGYTYLFSGGTTQTINNNWHIQGTCTSYIVLQTNTAGSFATVTKSSGQVPGHNIHIRDIHCTGGADFYAYNSVDLGGNTGWNFSTLPPLFNPGAISGPASVCTASIGITYLVNPVQGAIYYEWAVPAGATITSGQGEPVITVDFGSATSGDITVQSYNGCNYGTSNSSLPITFSASSTPTVTLDANPGSSICAGTVVTFTATTANTGTGTISYDFQINNVSVQSGSANTFTTSSLSNGDIVVCIISVSGSGCFSSASATSNALLIATSSPITPTVTIAVTPGTTVCQGQVLTFTAGTTNTANGLVNYDFQVNGSSVQNSNSNNYITSTYTNGDIVTCNISISGGDTCFSSTTASSNALSLAVTPSLTPTATLTATPGTTVCPLTNILFTATVSNTGNANVNYDFYLHGSIMQSSSSNIYTVYSDSLTTGDTIRCYIFVTGGSSCFTTNYAYSNPLVITIDPHAVNVNVNAGNDVSIHTGETTQLNGSGDSGTYLWSPATDLNAVNILNPIASPTTSTNYTLTITNSEGCVGSDDVVVTLTGPRSTVVVPSNAFTPNGDGINDKWIVTTNNSPLMGHVMVMNRNGKIVFESNTYYNDWQGIYRGAPLAVGTYYYLIEYKSTNGESTRLKGNVTILR